ncbi:MAG TPA: cation:proton antiporter [Nocardioidaceae bacterium]|nr:cation:proton antiporter [Nocardioidaceae bacterium]
MPEVDFLNLLGVLGIAVVAPLALGFAPRLRVPAVVLEILLGVVLGPHGLGWLEVDLAVQIVALLGLAMLLFLAGLEVELENLKGGLLPLAAAGYAVSLLLGWCVGLSLDAAGQQVDPLLVGVALSATSLGLVVAVLKDAGLLTSRTAQTTIAASSLADFAAVLLLSLLFSADAMGTGSQLALFLLFAVIVCVLGVAASVSARSMRLSQVLVRLQDTTAEIRVRGAVLLMVAFAVLAEELGLESILGAFLAGATLAALDRDSTSHPNFRVKLDAIGYGFLIPVFFVSSGMRLDVAGLLSSPQDLALLPVYVAALLLVRGLPAVLYLRTLGRSGAIASGLLQATSLPFIVAATQIGTLTGRISQETATGMVCGGLVSVLVFPVVAVGLARRATEAARPAAR